MKTFILASGSVRRAELLKKIVPRFEIYTPRVKEIKEAGALSPEAVAMINAKAKGGAAFKEFTDMGKDVVVIAADTVVVSPDGRLLNKPKDTTEAARHILAVAGGTHKVYTGFYIVSGVKSELGYDVTAVTLKPLNEKEARDYVADGHTLDKSGGYSIEELQSRGWVENIDGDIDNVIGLPTAKIKGIIGSF